MLTNKMLSDGLDIPLFKIRRWTKELLPPDPKATRRSGYARELSKNDGFMVYLGGYLVSVLSLAFAEALAVIKSLTPWLEQNGLLPDIHPDACREGADRKVKSYIIKIIRTNNPLEWMIFAEGEISRKSTFGGSAGSNPGIACNKIITESIRYNILDWLDICAFEKVERSKEKSIPEDKDLEKQIPVSRLLEIFLKDVLNNYSDWKEKWEALSDKK